MSEVANKKTFNLYDCVTAFFAYDERHVSLKQNDKFLGLCESTQHPDWVFGCSDTNLSEFGLVPLKYLKNIKQIEIEQ